MKQLMLGTAKWSNWVDCYKLLDNWPENGLIDCATNYPIDSIQDHFGLAETILSDYIKDSGRNFKINMKIGSISNDGSSENDLSRKFLIKQIDYYREKFGDNLDRIMIHWDNRGNETEIHDTILLFEAYRDNIGTKFGFSGLRYFSAYTELFDGIICSFQLTPLIDYYNFQIRRDQIDRYSELIKPENLQVYKWIYPEVSYEASLKNILADDRIGTILIGPSTVEHLNETKRIYEEQNYA